ncbi:MAG: hypothetical protein IPP64_00660 [Bacteroidetes bacterium]|nr:hypothetical protein [Bacteroidota bacterium]
MQKMLRCLFIALVVSSFSATAQDFSYSNVDLVSATFSGGNLNIRKDDGTGIYSAPQYVASAATQNPVAYVSGNAPTVAAAFTIDCPTVPTTINVRGFGSDLINFASVTCTVNPSATSVHTFNYPATVGSHVFTAAIVRFFKPYTINWEVSFDGGTTWKPVGTSSNTLYVTRSMPQSEGTNYKWYHTVFDLSCRNAQYMSLDTAIISHVWSEFTDQIVLNYNNDSLFYYKIMNSPNVTLGSLLQYRDAECYTFAQLFLAAIKIQGVIRTSNYVYITPINNTVCGYTVNRFIVKNWNFGTATGAATCSSFPWKNTYNSATGSIPPPYNQYVFLTSDVTDQSGIPGSCNIRPASYFNNHQIAKIDGVYYDACYGVTFPSLVSIKTAAFSGWSFRYTSGGTTNCFFTNNMSLSDLSESISTF